MAMESVEKLTALAKEQVATFTKSSTVALSGLKSLTKAYQDVAARTYESQVASLKTLSAVKSPTEFFEVQQKIVKDSVESSIADSKALSEITKSVVTTALEPVTKQFAAFQASFGKAA